MPNSAATGSNDPMAVERGAEGALYYNGQYVSAELEQYFEAEDRRLHELVEKSVAKSTRRAYASDWDSFVTWCIGRNFVPLPATDDTVARYLRWLIDRPRQVYEETYTRPNGKLVKRVRKQGPAKVATVARHLVSIAKAHIAASHPDPTKSLYVDAVLRGIRNERGVKGTPKKFLARETLRKILPAVPAKDAPRHLRIPALRDRALLLVAFSGAFRRSEVAGIDVEHLEYDDHGVAITLPRSKRNQEGQLERVLIPFADDPDVCAIRAIADWSKAAEIVEGPLFCALTRHGTLRDRRIQPALVATVVKDAIAAAQAANKTATPFDRELDKLDPSQFAAHSLRSGWISTGISEKRSELTMMGHSRHKSIAVFRGYVQRATQWDDHPGLGLL
jgi:integrase